MRYIRICLWSVCTLMLLSCHKTVEDEVDIVDASALINFNVLLDDELSTRVECAQFTTANLTAIGVFIDQQTATYKYSNRKISKQGDGSWKTSDGGATMLWETPSNPMAEVIAYAPYTPSVPAGNQLSVSMTDQSKADFIWTKDSVDKDMLVDGKIPIELYHQFAKVRFRFVLGVQAPNRNPKIADMKIIGTKTTGTFDLDDATLALNNTIEDISIDSIAGAATDDTIRIYDAIILPQTITKSTHFASLMLDDVERKMAVSTTDDMDFEGGKCYMITIRIGSNNLEISSVVVVPWEEEENVTMPRLDGLIKITGVNQDHLWAASIDTLQMFCNDPVNAAAVAKIKYLTVAGTSGDWSYLKKLGKKDQNAASVWGGTMPSLHTLKLSDVTEITYRMFCSYVNGSTSMIGFRTMKSFSAPKAVTVGEDAFRGCRDLENVYLPKVKTLGNGAFYFCNGGNLKQIVLDNVETIGKDAFKEVKTIEVVQMNSLKTYTAGTFADSKDKLRVVKMNGLETLPASAFRDYKTLEEVDMNGLKTIKSLSFNSCSKLENVSFKNVEKIEGDNVFNSCVNLKRIICPRLKTIGAGALCNCTKLEYIDFPAVENLGKVCMKNTRLKEIKLNQLNMTVTTDCFNNTPTTSCTLYLNAADPAVGTNTWQGKTWAAIYAYQ